MMETPYNALALDCFHNARHAGDDANSATTRQFSAQAAEFAGGPCVRIGCDVAEGRLNRVVFHAWGCPHFLAAAELLCRQLEGLDSDGVARLEVAELARQLAVPVEKTGRILTLEDAFSALKREISQSDSLKS